MHAEGHAVARIKTTGDDDRREAGVRTEVVAILAGKIAGHRGKPDGVWLWALG